MVDTKKEPAVGDPVSMPADEEAALRTASFGRGLDPFRHTHLTKEAKEEKKNAKSDVSKDEVVVDPNAAPAPAGYDKFGQPLKTEEERLKAGAPTSEEQQRLDDKLSAIDKDARDKAAAARKATEDGTYHKHPEKKAKKVKKAKRDTFNPTIKPFVAKDRK